MTVLEKDIERKFFNLAKARGGVTFKFICPNNPGVPDRIVITPSREVWFVELKTEEGRLSALQDWQIQGLEKRGMNVRVLYGWQEAKAFLQEVMPGEI